MEKRSRTTSFFALSTQEADTSTRQSALLRKSCLREKSPRRGAKRRYAGYSIVPPLRSEYQTLTRTRSFMKRTCSGSADFRGLHRIEHCERSATAKSSVRKSSRQTLSARSWSIFLIVVGGRCGRPISLHRVQLHRKQQSDTDVCARSRLMSGFERQHEKF